MEAIYAAVTLTHQQWMNHFRQGDAAGVAALYAETGQIMPIHSATIYGRAAIQAFWQGCMDMGICAMQRILLEMDCLGEVINEVGEYRFLDRQQRVLDVGKYVIIWKKQGGQWQMQCDIWTSHLSLSA